MSNYFSDDDVVILDGGGDEYAVPMAQPLTTPVRYTN